MSARPIADCEACLDALTELVCDELDAETRAAVLAHTKTCESCAKQLSQFRGVMSVAEAIPLEAPSPRVRQAVLLAAREAQSRKAVEAQSNRAPRESMWIRFSAWLERLGTWAMSPQVAMASVLLLMLGVGLVALPIGRDAEQAALRPAEESERATPAAAATAAPVPSPEESAPAADTLDSVAEKAVPEPSREFAKPMLEGRAETRFAKAPARRTRSAPKGGYAKDEDWAGSDDGLGALSTGVGGGGKAASSGQAVPSGLNRAEPMEQSAREFAPAPPPSPSAQMAESESPSVRADEKKADVNPEAALLAQGIRAAQSGDAKGAIAVLRPLAEKGSPSVRQTAVLWLARSYRSAGDCASALRYYAPLAASKSAAPSVLSETADCYERTGDLKQASVLRSRAEPVKAARAKASGAPSLEPAAKPAATQPTVADPY